LREELNAQYVGLSDTTAVESPIPNRRASAFGTAGNA
jgi:hypothetical protein